MATAKAPVWAPAKWGYSVGGKSGLPFQGVLNEQLAGYQRAYNDALAQRQAQLANIRGSFGLADDAGAWDAHSTYGQVQQVHNNVAQGDMDMAQALAESHLGGGLRRQAVEQQQASAGLQLHNLGAAMLSAQNAVPTLASLAETLAQQNKQARISAINNAIKARGFGSHGTVAITGPQGKSFTTRKQLVKYLANRHRTYTQWAKAFPVLAAELNL